MCSLIKISPRKHWLAFIIVSILVLNCMYVNFCEHRKECEICVPCHVQMYPLYTNIVPPKKQSQLQLLKESFTRIPKIGMKEKRANENQPWNSLMRPSTAPDLDRFFQPDIDNLIWSNVPVPLLSPRDACSLGPNITGPEILVMVHSAIVNFGRLFSSSCC